MARQLITIIVLVVASGMPSTAFATPKAPKAPKASPKTRQTSSSPAKTPADSICQRIGPTGCCAGERLIYCDAQGKLQSLDCRNAPRCGWRKTGRYDCNTAGNADPAGHHPRLCSLPDAGLPSDLGPTTSPSTCKSLTEEGCCFGDELRFCRDGHPHHVDCRNNRFCGWRGVAQAYNCGTEGKADPRGKYPRACPGAPDTGPLHFPDAQTNTGGSSHGGCSGSCACHLDHGHLIPRGEIFPFVTLILALLFRRRRR
ncbi:MAG: hypothetical protein KAI47_09060 [Deltaproteobacteria bacterium]|nr:hypothetical protein [Deltaproteobacteria bacterium]